jgi:hypothetical protein
MFGRSSLPLWIAFILLTGAFLTGQDSWPPQPILLLQDTGQLLCYDSTGQIECPAPGEPFYGQDTQYATGCTASYTDNGDGTVTDNCTGLVWQQVSDGVQRDWEGCLAYCEGLEYAGYSDWRLPNRRELESLVDSSRHTPSIDPKLFPDNLHVGFWSSTTHVKNPAEAWRVHFLYGGVGHYIKSGQYHARCVR